jgi:hypothetical protein
MRNDLPRGVADKSAGQVHHLSGSGISLRNASRTGKDDQIFPEQWPGVGRGRQGMGLVIAPMRGPRCGSLGGRGGAVFAPRHPLPGAS